LARLIPKAHTITLETSASTYLKEHAKLVSWLMVQKAFITFNFLSTTEVEVYMTGHVAPTPPKGMQLAVLTMLSKEV
jgi:hypothetical protein